MIQIAAIKNNQYPTSALLWLPDLPGYTSYQWVWACVRLKVRKPIWLEYITKKYLLFKRSWDIQSSFASRIGKPITKITILIIYISFANAINCVTMLDTANAAPPRLPMDSVAKSASLTVFNMQSDNEEGLGFGGNQAFADGPFRVFLSNYTHNVATEFDPVMFMGLDFGYRIPDLPIKELSFIKGFAKLKFNKAFKESQPSSSIITPEIPIGFLGTVDPLSIYRRELWLMDLGFQYRIIEIGNLAPFAELDFSLLRSEYFYNQEIYSEKRVQYGNALAAGVEFGQSLFIAQAGVRFNIFYATGLTTGFFLNLGVQF